MISPERIHAILALREWLRTRPESVQKLAAEFPINTALTIKGEKLHVIGYTEDDKLILSKTSLRDNYERAMKTKRYCCASHVR